MLRIKLLQKLSSSARLRTYQSTPILLTLKKNPVLYGMTLFIFLSVAVLVSACVPSKLVFLLFNVYIYCIFIMIKKQSLFASVMEVIAWLQLVNMVYWTSGQ